MLTAQERGELLEQGVKVIERHLLSVEGQVKDSDLNIETRKIIIHGGVHHEIDIYITVRGARGYDGVFVFECKNWKAKVDKNEIMIFGQKIGYASAQRGFFIAREFTADAQAQAALDPRIVLVTADAQELDQVFPLWDFHFIVINDRLTEVVFGTKGLTEEERKNLKPFDLEAKAVVNGVSMTLKEYVLAWVPEARDKRTSTWASHAEPEGDHQMEADDRRTFGPGEMIIDGDEMDVARLRLEFTATVVRPRVRARVDVEGRGTAVQLEDVKIGEGALGVWFTGAAPR